MYVCTYVYKGQQMYKRHPPKNKMYWTVSSYYFRIANIVLILYIGIQRINLSSFKVIDKTRSTKILGIHSNCSPVNEPTTSHLKVKTGT